MDRRTLGQTSAQATPRTEQRSSLLRRFASRPLLFAVALSLFGTTFTPVIRPALAGPQERVAYLNKQAMEDYDKLEFEQARKSLLDAVALLRRSGADRTPQAARTYINLGMVYIALKDKGRGLQQWIKALQINPKAKLDPALATPELQPLWDAAVAQASGAPAPALPPEPATPAPNQVPPSSPATDPLVQSPSPLPPAATPTATPTPLPPEPTQAPPPSRPPTEGVDDLLDPVLKVELRHVPVDDTRGNQRLNVYVTPVPVHQGAVAARVTLYYRGAGQERFSEVPMVASRRQQGDLLGQIPAEAVVGKSLQYYIQAFDGKGRVCGSQGSPENPMIIRISGSAIAVAQSQDIEDPILYVKRADAERQAMLSRDWVYLDLSVGTGGALVTAGANTEVTYFYNATTGAYERSRASSGGFIWSGLGVRGELGVFLWQGLSLGVSGRFEPYLNHNAESQTNSYYPGAACKDASGGPAPCFATTSKGQFGYMALGKLRYQFRKVYGNVFRPYIHLDFGGGEWRGSLNIDGSRPMAGGQVDASSPYQPTDLCSAEYNGKTGAERMPSGCNSVGQVAGYNKQDKTVTAVPTNLNRVCPSTGPCIDAVLLGKLIVGGGLGFYLGGRHAGISVDVNLLAAVGEQFGLFIDTYVGPQFNF
ncbi:MAG TPA: tetratricopeptide repeat protein [Pseudomonadota bacterium]|nr:tetratricopeptide repeat protein [Pseudomonadota bacterium]